LSAEKCGPLDINSVINKSVIKDNGNVSVKAIELNLQWHGYFFLQCDEEDPYPNMGVTGIYFVPFPQTLTLWRVSTRFFG